MTLVTLSMELGMWENGTLRLCRPEIPVSLKFFYVLNVHLAYLNCELITPLQITHRRSHRVPDGVRAVHPR